MSNRKKIVWGGLALFVTVMAGFCAQSFRKQGVVAVQTSNVVKQNLVSVATASGEITPRNYINIGANNMGRITEIYVKEGDHVSKGQVLAKLETIQPAAEVDAQKAGLGLMRAELSSAGAAVEASSAAQKTQQASLKRAQAELERAQINFDRASQLLEERLIAREEYDQRKADVEAARAMVEEMKASLEQFKAQQEQYKAQQQSGQRRVEQAEANLRRASDVLQKHFSVSPINGVVTNLPVRVGETAVPGIQNSSASLIMTIADMSLITAEVKVDETDIVNVKLEQQAEVSIDALPGATFRGRVIEIGNTAILRTTGVAASQSMTASQEAKDFKVVVALDDPPVTVRPGMSCTARITTATRESVLTIPIQALTIRLNSDLEPETPASAAQASDSPAANRGEEVEGVFVISDGTVQFRPVSVGITGANAVEVLSGLKEGEEIVTGSYKVLRTIRPGTRVTVDNGMTASLGSGFRGMA